jgi:hypothetical protein
VTQLVEGLMLAFRWKTLSGSPAILHRNEPFQFLGAICFGDPLWRILTQVVDVDPRHSRRVS